MPKKWLRTLAVSAGATLALAAPALAQERPDGPAPGDPPAGEQPQVSVPGAPTLSDFRVPNRVTAQRGHARFLVGVRLSEAAQLTVLISKAGDGTPVRTFTTEQPEDAGLNFLLIDAVDDQRFQLPGGKYQVRITATDSDDESSRPLTKTMALRLTRARGLLDVFLVPTTPRFAREASVEPNSGHIVAAAGPGGAAVKAGIRRGDVITKIGARTISTPGELQATLRGLKADRRIQVTFVRNGQERVGVLSLDPDWTEAPDYQRVLTVARRRSRSSMVVAYAQAKERLDAGEVDVAKALRGNWPAGWRKTAEGESLSGEIFEAQEKHKQALGAFNRALKKSPRLAAARFGRGVARAGLGQNEAAATEFGAAAKLDPGDASAHAFEAYVLIRADQPAEARNAAAQAIRLDPRYPDGHLPFGIALLSLDEQRAGIKAVRTGLRLLADEARADSLIEEHLDSSEG